MSQHLVDLWGARGGIDQDKLKQRVCKMVEDIQAGQEEMETGRTKLNEILRHSCQIDWRGRFGDLLASDAEFPASVRRDFYVIEGEGSSPAIEEKSISDFIDFFGTWGI